MSSESHSAASRPASGDWDISVDVLVIGSGKGALTAALCSDEMGAGDIGTQGGLVTNSHDQVLRTDGEPIAGLYASGNCTAAVMPTYPGPGATLVRPWCSPTRRLNTSAAFMTERPSPSEQNQGLPP